MASCIAETATAPIDVVKVRLQLQGEMGATRLYSGAFDCFRKVVANEGARGLYKGLSAALLRQATYGSIRFGVYEPIKSALLSERERQAGVVPLYKKVASGMASGAVSSGLCTPTDLVKVRMQADKDGTRYRGVFSAFREIARTEGLAGLYEGVSPTVQRAMLVAAVELSTYDDIKTALIVNGILGDHVGTHFTASLIAGFLATFVSSPTDVIKSRVMNQEKLPDGRPARYTGTVDCAVKSVRAEGLFSLWKGFWPNFARLGPHTVICFIVIEQVSRALARWRLPAPSHARFVLAVCTLP